MSGSRSPSERTAESISCQLSRYSGKRPGPVHRPDSEGREATGPAGPAVGKGRIRHQPQDREGARAKPCRSRSSAASSTGRFRPSAALLAIHTLNEAPHPDPSANRAGIIPPESRAWRRRNEIRDEIFVSCPRGPLRARLLEAAPGLRCVKTISPSLLEDRE
jgi:hypothetical protein